jgi:DNA-binding transcriptional ArsR family regulator
MVVLVNKQVPIRCNEDEIHDVVAMFKALSDPTRLQIISVLTQGSSICVSEIARELNMSISRVSHHLSMLEKLGFTRHRQDGKQVYYTIDDEIMARAQEHVRGN